MLGDGTEENPYQITNVEEFLAIQNSLSASYILQSDLDFLQILKKQEYVPIGNNDMPFHGKLDGNGHILRNLKQKVTQRKSGLFGVVGTQGSIQNLTLIDVYFSTEDICTDEKGIMCFAKNDALRSEKNFCEPDTNSSSCIGLIAGESAGDILNCMVMKSNLYTLNAEVLIGGICGRNLGLVQCSAVIGTLGTEGESSNVGGISGSNEGVIDQCWTEGIFFALSEDINTFIGGVTGLNASTGMLSDCWSRACVFSANFVGGLIGQNYGDVYRCYAQGKIVMLNSLEHAGGLAGISGNAQSFYGCVYDRFVTGKIAACLAGNDEGTTAVDNTLAMHEKSTFIDFDFDSVWDISTEHDFGVPYLRSCPFPLELISSCYCVFSAIVGKQNWRFCSSRELYGQFPFRDGILEATVYGMRGLKEGETFFMLHYAEDAIYFLDGSLMFYQVEVWPEYGTEYAPFLIQSKEKLVKFINDTNNEAYAYLKCDLDYADRLWQWQQKIFVGHLDGGGHTISHIRLHDEVYAFLKEIEQGAFVKNLTVCFEGDLDCLGGMVELNAYNATIDNCHVNYLDMKVWRQGVGLLIYNYGTVCNCSINGRVFVSLKKCFSEICEMNRGSMENIETNVEVIEDTKTMEREDMIMGNIKESNEKAVTMETIERKEKTFMAAAPAGENGITAVQTCVAVGFKLLNVSLVGTYESHEDGSKELLIQPSVNYAAEPFGISDLIGGINDFFKGVCGKEQVEEDSFKAGLEQFLKDLNLDTIGISLKQIFVHVIKPKSGDAKVEYAFSVKLENAGSATPKDFTFASLDSITFGIWNTDNKRILAGMGLLSIAEQLAS